MNLPYDDSSSLEWDIILPDDVKHKWIEISIKTKFFCRKKFLPSREGVLKIGSSDEFIKIESLKYDFPKIVNHLASNVI